MSSFRKGSAADLKQSIPRASSVKARERVTLLKQEVMAEVQIKSKLKKELVTLRNSIEKGKGYLKSR
jgi:hypothetical protein